MSVHTKEVRKGPKMPYLETKSTQKDQLEPQDTKISKNPQEWQKSRSYTQYRII